MVSRAPRESVRLILFNKNRALLRDECITLQVGAVTHDQRVNGHRANGHTPLSKASFSRRERASCRKTGGLFSHISLLHVSPRLHTGFLQGGLRQDLLAHQRKREARGVQVPPRQVTTKRFRCQPGMTILILLLYTYIPFRFSSLLIDLSQSFRLARFVTSLNINNI